MYFSGLLQGYIFLCIFGDNKYYEKTKQKTLLFCTIMSFIVIILIFGCNCFSGITIILQTIYLEDGLNLFI